MDYREKLAEEKSGLRGLVLSIPGFKGYGEKDLRREADKLLRSYLAGRLQEQRDRLSELQVSLVKSKQLTALGEVERVVTKLQGLIDRLRTASYGYAGWFDAVSVKTEELDGLYQFDQALVAGVDEMTVKINALAQAVNAGGDGSSDLAAVKALLVELGRDLERRSQVLYES